MNTYFSKMLRMGTIAMVCVFPTFSHLAAAEPATNVAQLIVNGKKTVLKHVIAVKGKYSGEPRIIVMASSRKLTAPMIKAVKEKDADENLGFDLEQYMTFVFQEDGTWEYLIARTSNSSFSNSASSLGSKVTIADGRIRGNVKFVKEGDFSKDVTLPLDLVIDDASALEVAPVKLDPAVKPTVSGVFKGNGKQSELKYVLVEEREKFSDKEAITLIFTEKDPKTSKKPSFDAMFDKLGSALILNVFYEGGIFGCQVMHSAHSKRGFSALGEIRMEEFDMPNGNVAGHVTTGGELDAFGEKWEVDLKFAAPLPEKLRAALIAPPKSDSKPAESKTADKDADDDDDKPMKSGPSPLANQLPLPIDAKNVEFKALVEQIQCSSAQQVGAITKDLSGKLAKQGWKEEGGSLKTPRNAILKLGKDGAKLTIMIQPAPQGSTVKIFTEGLDWTGAENSSANSTPAKDSKDDSVDVDAIEKEANKAIQDALKNIPGL